MEEASSNHPAQYAHRRYLLVFCVVNKQSVVAFAARDDPRLARELCEAYDRTQSIAFFFFRL